MSSIHIVAAVALNGVIGNSETNSLPWHLPSDLAHFKALTTGRSVLMGRKTFESIGRPLPYRKNIVITSDPGFKFKHKVQTACSVAEAVAKYEEDLYVIGGQRIFEEAVHLSPKTFCITVILANPDGDVMFPFAGRNFLGKIFLSPELARANSMAAVYHDLDSSELLEENGFRFKFTRYVVQ